MEKEDLFQNFVQEKRGKKFFRLVLWPIAFFLLCFALYLSLITPPEDFKTNSIFTVDAGESLHSIASRLQSEKFIRSKTVFETMVTFYGGEKRVVVGDYSFPKKTSVISIAKKFATGDRELGVLKITIPEGFDNLEIAELVALKLKNFNKEDFLYTARNLQGKLFPDTYFFSTTDDENDVIEMLTKNFKKKTEKIFLEIKNKGKNDKEILIMASVLEKEANGANDRNIIAGILWQRLSIGMPLQVDAAPETYKNKGLPVAPISNPGLVTIEAALYPKTSEYLYYLHDREGETHYAKTFVEHRQNIKKYLK